jgi:imidazolonepropionase-like amidohydrolase
MRTILQPTWLIDGTGAPPVEHHSVILNDTKIEAVLPTAQYVPQPGDQTVDLTGQTLIPGLINNHVHLNLPGDNTIMVPWIEHQTDASLALRSAANAMISLRAGVTTVRDCGGRNTTILDLRDAQTAGLIGGARIISCGWPITITGGHTRHFGGEADGTDGLRKAVRRAVSLGADYIKVMASGGGTPGTLPHYPSYTTEELRTIVEAAHDLGKLVAMHCIATESIARAVAAGTDLIEHAMFYDTDLIPRYNPAVAERLAKSGIAVTPTMQVNRDLIDLLPGDPNYDRWLHNEEEAQKTVANLKALGVPLLAGSDSGWRATAFDTFWKELHELTLSGLTPAEAIHSATGAVTKTVRLHDTFGTITPGLLADLVAVNGNVANDIALLQSVKHVYQSGKPVA